VARLGGLHGDLDGLHVAHLADQDHLGRLPQRRAQSEGERARVRAHLALVHGGLHMLVHVLHRVLDGEDVVGELVVDLVDDGGEGRGLARAGGSGDQDDAVFELGDVVQLLRELELLQRRHAFRDDAQHHRVGAALREDVDPEAGLLRDGVREVHRAVLEQRAGQLAVAAQQVEGDRLGLKRRELRQPGEVDRHELAVDLHLRRAPHREVQVGDPLGHLEHGLQHGVEVEVLHPGLSGAPRPRDGSRLACVGVDTVPSCSASPDMAAIVSHFRVRENPYLNPASATADGGGSDAAQTLFQTGLDRRPFVGDHAVHDGVTG
jgi:hypothetical protein